MRVFIASADDVAEERNVVNGVISRMKPLLEALCGKGMEIIRWEDQPPSPGNPQKTIMELGQFHSIDIFVHIAWGKFGTPPGTKGKNRRLHRSGTQQEFETAYENWTKSGSPWIMSYRCGRPFLPSHVPEQSKQVEAFFKRFESEHIGVYKKYMTPSDLEEKFWQDFPQVVIRILDKGADRLTSLRESVGRYRRSLNAAMTIDNLVDQHSETLLKYAESLTQSSSARVTTLTLYQTILECLVKFSDVMIVDHDVNRWHELIDERDRIANTFNYSIDIIAKCINRAKFNVGQYSVKRLFLLTEDDVERRGETTVKILRRIQEHLREVEPAMPLKVLVVKRHASAKEQVLQHTLLKNKDFVLARDANQTVLLREFIDYNTRQNANETMSELSTNPDHIVDAERCFVEAYRSAIPVSKFLKDYDARKAMTAAPNPVMKKTVRPPSRKPARPRKAKSR